MPGKQFNILANQNQNIWNTSDLLTKRKNGGQGGAEASGQRPVFNDVSDGKNRIHEM